MSKKNRATAPLLLALMLSWSLGCRRSEPPASSAPAAEREAEEVERAETREPRKLVGREEQEEREEAGEREDDSEEAKETAEENRMRQRALEQLQEYRAKSCTEAIAKITELLRTRKGRWMERNTAGKMPTDLVRTLMQAELWGAQSEPVCKDDPARNHLDDLRNLMTAIWQYPRAVPRDDLERRLRLIG